MRNQDLARALSNRWTTQLKKAPPKLSFNLSHGNQVGLLGGGLGYMAAASYRNKFLTAEESAAAEAAQTQIAAGADVLTGSAQQVVGAIEAIEGAGGYWFGTQSDQSGEWPETVVASQVFNWTPSLGRMVELVVTGVYGGEAYALTFENGGLEVGYGGVELADDVVSAADAAVASIVAGDIEVMQELPE